MRVHFADKLNPELKKNTLWFSSPRAHFSSILYINLFSNPLFHKQDKSTSYELPGGENNDWVNGTESQSVKNTYYFAAIADRIFGLLRISIFKPATAKMYNESV